MPGSTVCLTFDFDALSVWLAYERVTPAMLARGEYGARVGVPRVLELLASHRVPATFFVPGHTVESFPRELQRILAAGHEVAHHSYAHVDPSNQTRAEEEADMDRAWRALEAADVTPLGFRAPSADLSPSTLELVEARPFLYDSSLMADDYRPFRPRIGDRVARAEPLVRGREAGFWELPLSFELDDWVHFQFNFDPYRRGGSPPSEVGEIWRAEFDWMDENVEGGVLTFTMHPQVIARGSRIAMLDGLVRHMGERGARFSTMADVARGLSSRS
ncbi:MAG: polysaccharide deacetylase [Thermoleophilia bacterium]|nr:polysaccharide deacetylase [Thermoleophilia bacterium]